MADILIVEDDANLGFSLRTALSTAGHRCRLAEDTRSAEMLCRESLPDLALMDFCLPDGNALELMERLHQQGLRFPVVMMTAFGTVSTAVTALKRGATDFIEKPQSISQICELVERVLQDLKVSAVLNELEAAPDDADAPRLIGRCPRMVEVLRTADRIAALPVSFGEGVMTTLILGDSGTGKEMVARYIHHHSPQREAPFVHVVCTAIPEHLLESVFFGHERGSFTDAKTRREGLLDSAQGGTLFLDEIGDMPLALQAKLLVAIETGRFRRVGDTSEQRLDFRVIAATNCDLAARVKAGTFRADLFHRLNMFALNLPPLRERGDDLPLLAEHLLHRFARQLNKPVPALDQQTLAAIQQHDWPGNVRELAHVLLRAMVMNDGPKLILEPLSLSSGPAAEPRSGLLQMDLTAGGVTLEEVERRCLQAALDHAEGNITRAARLLGMTRGTLRYRLEKHRIQCQDISPENE